MINPEIRDRYLRDTLSVRLGGLAADLARIVSFSQNQKSAPVVTSLLEESRYFIEWSAPDLLPERVDDASQLVELGRSLTRWYWSWSNTQNNPVARAELAAQAQQWSDQVLEMSGLLNTTN